MFRFTSGKITYRISNWPSLIDQVASFSRMVIQFKTDDRSTINVCLVYGEKTKLKPND